MTFLYWHAGSHVVLSCSKNTEMVASRVHNGSQACMCVKVFQKLSLRIAWSTEALKLIGMSYVRDLILFMASLYKDGYQVIKFDRRCPIHQCLGDLLENNI